MQEGVRVLFNSYAFLFFFLPMVLVVFFALGRRSAQRAHVWLLLASLAFYGFWDVRFLPLLLLSIAGNYFVSGRILAGRRLPWFLLGLAFDLGLLGYYKYLGFFVSVLDAAGAEIPVPQIVLPLGISFFTITQVLFLYDCYAGTVQERRPLDYALFVAFFPHLLAGPILYHKQMMAQFRQEGLTRICWENVVRGGALFVIGLAKKVLLADAFAPFVAQGFSHAADLSAAGAWTAAGLYMIQLYFDFSGYSDMAVGLSRMMNLEIPVNFNAPYRAASLINFWQRWHISLTNAITACVYLPLLRHLSGTMFRRTMIASFVAFFVVGIWHGAGWTFVVFALLHATGIVVNYVWRYCALPCPRWLGHVLTLGFVLVTMVVFRAADVAQAGLVLTAMLGGSGQMLAGVPWALVAAAVVILAVVPPSQVLVARFFRRDVVWLAGLLGLFVFAVLQLNRYSEFLYFQF